MAKDKTLSPQTARRLAISKQHLAGPLADPNPEGIFEIFNNLGCIQIDPIRAVERTQLLVLWSRVGNFDPDDLDKLLWQERRLFEYWAHAASIVLTEDYPIYRRHMRDWLVGDKAWKKRTREWLAENDELRRYILEEIRQNGPSSSREFKDHSQKSWESSGWTSGQNVTLMLNSLWRLGEITVSHRKGLTKFYDLVERVLPEQVDRPELSWTEVVYEASQRSLQALGVARRKHIEEHFTRGRYPGLNKTLDRLEKDGLVMRVRIADQNETWPGQWYLHTRDLMLLESIESGDWEPRTNLLSPFDNLICDRERTEQMFDFHFRIEIYVPAAKRKHGYYVMPVVHGDRIIGRIDPKMDRKKKRLRINAAYLEPGIKADPGLTGEVIGAINRLGAFAGATGVEYAGKAKAAWPGLG